MSELAADGIPVAVSLRVLKLSRQPHYRWREQHVTPSELIEVHRANALFDAHRDDPEFGYRFIAGETETAGQRMRERTAWRIRRDNQWWSGMHHLDDQAGLHAGGRGGRKTSRCGVGGPGRRPGAARRRRS